MEQQVHAVALDEFLEEIVLLIVCGVECLELRARSQQMRVQGSSGFRDVVNGVFKVMCVGVDNE